MRLPAARALQNIQTGNISPGYLLLGKEIYWRDRIWEALRKALEQNAGSLSLLEFDLRHDSLIRVVENAQAWSLLASRQLLLVRNTPGLAARRQRQTEESSDRTGGRAKPSHDLAAYFQHPNPSSTLVLEMMDVDLASEDWREREKVKARLAAFENLCDVVLLAPPAFGEAMQLVRQEAAERGRKISPEAAELLVTALDRDMGQIRMEIEKLCLYRPEKESVSVEDLDPMIPASPGGAGLALTEAIGAHDPGKALEVLEGLERSGKYPPLVVSEVARYLRQLILLKENKVRDPRQCARILWGAKIPAPQSCLPGLMEQARHFSGTQLLRGLELAFEADLVLRSSPPSNRIILERLVLELIRSSQSRERRVPQV